MLPDIALAQRLQALDRNIANLEREVAILPKQIAQIEKKLDEHTRRYDADRVALAANQRDRKKLDGDVQANQQKISKLRDQTLGAKTNEQYRAFQNEISYAEGEIRKAEDKVLDLMEQSESLDKNVKTAEVELKKQRQHVEAEQLRARERTAVDEKALAEARAERKLITDQMDPKVYKEYERIRKKTKGTVIAVVNGDRCDACQIFLRPQFLQDLRRGDTIMFCESCSRILTFNTVVDLSSDIAAAHRIA